jgi:hypothetical protein
MFVTCMADNRTGNHERPFAAVITISYLSTYEFISMPLIS